MNRSPRPSAATRIGQAIAERMGWVIGAVFLSLAAWFVAFAPAGDIGPLPPATKVSELDIRPEPLRTVVGEPALVTVGGFAMGCMECHRFFDSPPVERRILTQHTNIRFEHGQNNRCFNCHDRENRGRLIRYDGTLLGFNDVPRLCSQCHGTVFRDWQRGMHGKTLGSWDPNSGRQRRLACHECHDPHAPAYAPMRPLPAPNTLRMGPQAFPHGHEGHRNPLDRPWDHATAAPTGIESAPSAGGHEP